MRTAAPALGAVAFPGIPEAAVGARQYVRSMLEPHGVNVDDAAVAVSELFTNAITHSRSCGGIVGVSVFDTDGGFRVEVIDQGSDNGGPVLREEAGESGRGLHLVAAYAAEWGWERRRGRNCELTVVWFEMPAAGG